MAGGSMVPGTIDALEEAFMQAHDLWRRSPGDGRWPFASDGPWYLAQAEVGDVKGDQSETLLTTDAGRELLVRKVDSIAPRCPLDAGEVALRDRITAWLGLVPDALLRRAVWRATGQLAAGEARVGWKALAAALRWTKTPDALARAYRRELALLLCALNGWPTRRAKVLIALEGLVDEPRGRASFVVEADGEA